MITQQADRDKPVYLGTTHVLILRPNTLRTEFDSKKFHIEFAVDKLVLGQVLLRELRILL
jgi:hypothetical protein